METTNQLASKVGEEDSNPQAVIMFITAAGVLVNMNSAAMKLSRRIVFSMSCCLSQCFSSLSLLLNFARLFWFTTSSFPLHLRDFSLIFKWRMIDFQVILPRDLGIVIGIRYFVVMCKVTSLSVSSWVLRAQQRGEVWGQSRMIGCRWSRGRTGPRCYARSRCTDRGRGCRRCRRSCWSSFQRTAPQWWTPSLGGDSSESCRQSLERPGAKVS